MSKPSVLLHRRPARVSQLVAVANHTYERQKSGQDGLSNEDGSRSTSSKQPRKIPTVATIMASTYDVESNNIGGWVATEEEMEEAMTTEALSDAASVSKLGQGGNINILLSKPGNTETTFMMYTDNISAPSVSQSLPTSRRALLSNYGSGGEVEGRGEDDEEERARPDHSNSGGQYKAPESTNSSYHTQWGGSTGPLVSRSRPTFHTTNLNLGLSTSRNLNGKMKKSKAATHVPIIDETNTSAGQLRGATEKVDPAVNASTSSSFIPFLSIPLHTNVRSNTITNSASVPNKDPTSTTSPVQISSRPPSPTSLLPSSLSSTEDTFIHSTLSSKSSVSLRSAGIALMSPHHPNSGLPTTSSALSGSASASALAINTPTTLLSGSKSAGSLKQSVSHHQLVPYAPQPTNVYTLASSASTSSLKPLSGSSSSLDPANISTLVVKCKDLESKCTALTLELSVLRRTSAQSISKAEKMRLETENKKLTSSLLGLQERLNMLEGVSDRVHLADQLKEKNEKLERLEHRLSILTKQLDLSEGQVSDLARSARSIEELQQEIRDKDAEIAKLSTELDHMTKVNKNFQVVHDQTSAKLSQLERALRHANEYKVIANNEAGELKTQLRIQLDITAQLESKLQDVEKQKNEVLTVSHCEVSELNERITIANAHAQAAAGKLAIEHKRCEDLERLLHQSKNMQKNAENLLLFERKKSQKLETELNAALQARDKEAKARREAEQQVNRIIGESRSNERALGQAQLDLERTREDLSIALTEIRKMLQHEKSTREKMERMVEKLEHCSPTQESEASRIVRSNILGKVLAFAVDAAAGAGGNRDVSDDEEEADVNTLAEKARPGGKSTSRGKGEQYRLLRARAQAALRNFVLYWKKPLSLNPSRATMDISTATAAVDLVTNWAARVNEVAHTSNTRSVARFLVSSSLKLLTRMTAEFGATYDTAPIDGFVTLLSTHPGRPAYRAGFRKNDVIIQVDDTPITSNEALRRAIRSKPPGSDVTIYFIRGARNILALEPTPGEPLSLLRKQQARLLSQRIDQGAIGAVTLTLCAVGYGARFVANVNRIANGDVFESDVRRYTRDYEAKEAEVRDSISDDTKTSHEPDILIGTSLSHLSTTTNQQRSTTPSSTTPRSTFSSTASTPRHSVIGQQGRPSLIKPNNSVTSSSSNATSTSSSAIHIQQQMAKQAVRRTCLEAGLSAVWGSTSGDIPPLPPPPESFFEMSVHATAINALSVTSTSSIPSSSNSSSTSTSTSAGNSSNAMTLITANVSLFSTVASLAENAVSKRSMTIVPNNSSYRNSISTIINNNTGEITQRFSVREQAELYLGGSCHPTTWRRDIAIPVCEQQRVTYYNPQVDDWTPDLVSVEAKAKEESSVLFFVIDDKTRAIGSMLEASEYIGRGRTVVLVIQPIPPNAKIGDDVLSPTEIRDLNRARTFLHDVAIRHGAPIYTGNDAIARGIEDAVGRCNGRVDLGGKTQNKTAEDLEVERIRDLEDVDWEITSAFAGGVADRDTNDVSASSTFLNC